MTEIHIPTRPDEITPEWSTAMLRAAGRLGKGRVEGVTVEPIGVGRGYVGQTLRLRFAYAGQGRPAQSSFVAKLPTFVELDPVAKSLIGQLYATEINWYREMRNESPVRTPEYIWSGAQPETARYCLVLEDLGHLRLVDQIESCSPDQARRIVRTLARLHAAWWESPRLVGTPWLPTPQFQAFVLQAIFTAGWEAFWETLGPGLGREFEAGGRRIGETLPALIAEGAASAKTLVHGDYRLENFLFGEPDTADELAVLDWQGVAPGSGPRDLAYFMGQSLTVEARRSLEPELLRLYHDELEGLGVRGYAFDRCREDYLRGLLIAMFIPVNGVAALRGLESSGGGDLTRDQEEIFNRSMETGLRLIRVMTERNVAAIADNRALDVIG